MTSHAFHELMAVLLRRFNLHLAIQDGQDVVSLHFEGEPSVHLIDNHDAACLDVMTDAGQVRSLEAANELLPLITPSIGSRTGYSATISVHRASRTVVVWARQPYAVLDLASLERLLGDLRTQANALRRALDRPGTGDPAPVEGTMHHLKRFMRQFNLRKRGVDRGFED